MSERFFPGRLLAWAVLAVLLSGCGGPSSPARDPDAVRQEQEKLNRARQKEWNPSKQPRQ